MPLRALTGDAFFAPAVDGTHRRLQSKRDGRSYWRKDIQSLRWYDYLQVDGYVTDTNNIYLKNDEVTPPYGIFYGNSRIVFVADVFRLYC